MVLNRIELLEKFNWLKEKNHSMIISADYDGLICASFLHHHLNWKLEGYYDLKNIWISESGLKKKKDLIWVDLNILPKQGRAIGGHVISLEDNIPKGFESSCNPNILANINSNEFKSKFPFSTLIYLLWMHNVSIQKNIIAKLLILHSDSAWLKFQNYDENCQKWIEILSNYDWKILFEKINTKGFERKFDQNLYPLLKQIKAVNEKSKLKSKYLNIQSLQYQFNPDWDENVILHLLKLFAKEIGWTPPKIPIIINRIEGKRNKIPLAYIKEVGLLNFIKEKRIFSYAIPSPRIFNFTTFGHLNKSPLEKTSCN